MGEYLSKLEEISGKNCRKIIKRVIKQFGDREMSDEVVLMVRNGDIKNSVLFSILTKGLGNGKQHVSRFQDDIYDYKPRRGRQI